MSIGERLRDLRNERNLTLEQAGAIGGTTKQSMSQIEKGLTREPGGLALFSWARYYGVNLEWLITGKGKPDATASQDARPEFDKIAAAVNLLLHYLELVGDPLEWIHDPVLLETAYLVAEEFGHEVRPDNVLDLTKILARRIRGDVDEQQRSVGRARAASGGKNT
ncbi:helix-turn-helix transcriptional regulator [Xanthomonas melonis]|uniref:helix-turn-helix domain-containing protein n=1 Tax=Xanthomonas melonis TaxID=56456 RepID=UPI001E53B476|nr:helix-turn-helix transcriptional regulator [Xanthomonas melonis]MCD0280498.1 helix-turn-helix transcriptional regulator [Xanthomonas melonis]